METIGVIYYRGCIRIIGYMLGLYRDNGKENGHYSLILGYI